LPDAIHGKNKYFSRPDYFYAKKTTGNQQNFIFVNVINNFPRANNQTFNNNKMSTASLSRKALSNSIIINAAAILLIYFTPALTHFLNFPLYLIEPMRLMLVLAMIHSDRRNAYLLALTLPLFSYAVSAHPVIYKMLLITAELLFNVWLFYTLRNRMKNTFAAMASAIVISKSAYYGLKAIFISAALVGPGLISTPLWIQVITTLIFSGYAMLFFKNKA